MVKHIVSFETTDGKKFLNEAEANGHETLISVAAAVDAYAAAAELGLAETTRAKRYISGYLAFVETYEGDLAYTYEAEVDDEAAPAPVHAAAPAVAHHA